MEGKEKSNLVIKNPTTDMLDDSRVASGKRVIIPKGVRLDAAVSELTGVHAFNGGTGGIEYKPIDAKGHLGVDQGQSENYSVSRVRGSERETEAVKKSVAGLTEIDVPKTEAQLPSEDLNATNVRESTLSSETQHFVNVGVSGTDPGRGVPMQVYTEHVLLHPTGIHEEYSEVSEKPNSEVLYESVKLDSSKAMTSDEKKIYTNCDMFGVNNMSDMSEGSYILQGAKITFKKDGSFSWEPVGLHRVSNKVSPHIASIRDSKRRRFHNRLSAEVEYINDNSTDSRQGAYAPFNSLSKRTEKNRAAYYIYRRFLLATGAYVTAAWDTAIRSNSFMRYRLSLDGQREDTFIGENFLGLSDCYASSDDVLASEFDSVDSRFSSSHWMKGSVFNTVLLHESDKKFTDHHGKVPALLLDKNHLHAFADGSATRALGTFMVDREFAEALKEASYYTYENTDASNRLFLTDCIGLSFDYDVSKEFVGSDEVEPEEVMDSMGNTAKFAYSSTKTAPFVSVRYVDGTSTTSRIVIQNPLFKGLRTYLSKFAPAWYQKLSKGKGVTTGADSYTVYVPFCFSVTQPSMLATLIAESITYISKAQHDMQNVVGGIYEKGSEQGNLNKNFEFEDQTIEFTNADGYDVRLTNYLNPYQAIELPSRHYSVSSDTKNALFHGIMPGVFATDGSDYLHWFNRDVFTKRSSSFSVTATGGLNTSISYSLVEAPAYASAVDYAWDKNVVVVEDADFAKAYPMLSYQYRIAQRGINRINVPYRSTISAFCDTSFLFGISSKTFYRQNRLLSVFTEPDEGELDKYIGIPLADNSNPAGTGRLVCMIPDSRTDFGTISWYLNQPRNNAIIHPLTRNLWYHNVNDNKELVKVNKDGSIVVTPVDYNTSILNSTGISIYSWYKGEKPSGSHEIYKRYAGKSNLLYLSSSWTRWDMDKNLPSTVWNIPVCIDKSLNIAPLNQVISSLTAWASGYSSAHDLFDGEFKEAYSGDTFHATDSGRVIFSDIENGLLLPTDDKGSTTYGAPKKVDYAGYIYGKTWIFRDPLCMFDRLMAVGDVTCNHDAWLEMNGFGGWTAQDFTAAAEVADNKTNAGGNSFLYRLRESGIINALLEAGQESVGAAEDHIAVVEQQTSEAEAAS